jgi:hypothetical protein
MKIQTINLLVATALLSLFGCGGSSTTSQAAVLTKESARDAVKQAAGSVSDVRSANSNREQKTRQSDGPLSGMQVGDPFDVGPGLFGRVSKVESSLEEGNRFTFFEVDMFEDEKLTSKVGYQNNLLKFQTQGTVNETDFHFTAGSFAPQRLKNRFATDSNSGFLQIDQLQIDKDDQGRVYEQTLKLTRETFESKLDFETSFSVGGSRYLFVGSISPDGTWESNWTNSQGYKINWRVNPDGTGSIRVENANNPLCPATGVYGTDGKGTLTYADGTTESFDVNNTNFWQ